MEEMKETIEQISLRILKPLIYRLVKYLPGSNMLQRAALAPLLAGRVTASHTAPDLRTFFTL